MCQKLSFMNRQQGRYGLELDDDRFLDKDIDPAGDLDSGRPIHDRDSDLVADFKAASL